MIKHFERATAEISPHLTDIEIDKIVDFTQSISGSKWDINPTPGECVTQLKIILGEERWHEIMLSWGKINQHVLTPFGNLKYKEKSTGKLYDGLDPEDDATAFDKIYV